MSTKDSARPVKRRGVPGAVADAGIVARRNLLQLWRSPSYVAFSLLQPVIFVLLFTWVFGGAILPQGDYISFVMPGIIVEMIGFDALGTATGMNSDLRNGIIDRFRSLPMARSAVLGGRVLADTVRTLSSVLIVTAVGWLLGFRLTTGLLPVLAALALATAFGIALIWLNAWIGLTVRSPEAVQAASMIWLFPLVFGSSAFVPVETMPQWLQVAVNVNPITSVVDAIRGLVLGGPVAMPVLYSLAWIIGLTTVFWSLSVHRYQRMKTLV
ncbi:ABC transporter permease [Kibdelosporangium aridum]|uniref:ABC transporter permease n=1 Tax=Kibdelosporangium aridum TaxID=2030 RepID=UPI0021AD8514|nr:ABC transporter permease [Kibdelosporangium aridum]